MESDSRQPFETLWRMVHGYQLSQALYVAASLRIADLLSREALFVDQLASAAGAHAPSLYRLLRFLASHGVFEEDDSGRFALTPIAEYLRQDRSGSLQAWTIMVASPSFWSSWGDLLGSVKTGETAFPRVHGMDRWEFLARFPQEAASFDAAMTANTALESKAVVAAYDFSPFAIVADIGGGAGGLLAEILVANPGIRGVLFDQPHVIKGAQEFLSRARLIDRCELREGDFFEAVPKGADVYVLKSVIHDWQDDKAIAILKECRSAMTTEGKLVLVERVILPGNDPDPAKYMDLLMLVMNGGRERTEEDFSRLLSASGFHLSKRIPTATALSLIEAVPL